MKVAVYGNNLNQGYWLVRNLRRVGVEATLLMLPYRYPQEYHDWWSNDACHEDWIYSIGVTDLDLRALEPLSANKEVRRTYDFVRAFDVLFLSEDGPAFFSEFTGKKRVFRPAGADLQLIPFWGKNHGGLELLRGHLGVGFDTWRESGRLSPEPFIRSLKNAAHGRKQFYRYQERQRMGLRRCDAIITNADRGRLLGKLGLARLPVHHVPFPMDIENLGEIDRRHAGELDRKYRDIDIVFLHPSRHFFLNRAAKAFGKGNDILIRGFARFLRDTEARTRLVLVEKGSEMDIAAIKALITRLGIEDAIEWTPELPNKILRSYYALEKTVVCGYFNKQVQRLANTGREASFYGRPLITGYGDFHRRLYGDDQPPHVFPALTADEIAGAMSRIERTSAAEKQRMSEGAKAWFARYHTFDTVLPRYMEIFETVLGDAA